MLGGAAGIVVDNSYKAAVEVLGFELDIVEAVAMFRWSAGVVFGDVLLKKLQRFKGKVNPRFAGSIDIAGRLAIDSFPGVVAEAAGSGDGDGDVAQVAEGRRRLRWTSSAGGATTAR
jgi:hypothetical protein